MCHLFPSMAVDLLLNGCSMDTKSIFSFFYSFVLFFLAISHGFPKKKIIKTFGEKKPPTFLCLSVPPPLVTW